MLLDQAIYGAVRNGHGLRCASGDQKLASELAHRLDLPDTAPPGADWSPFVSGFALRDHYVIAKTFSDTSASRAGMVLTHALICKLNEIVEANDLRPIFDRLITCASQAPTEVDQLSMEAGLSMPPRTPDLASAAQLLITRGKGPVVRIGTGGFEQLVTALWGQLWPSIRCRFSFRLSFGPNDIVEQPEPTLVCTPAALIGRWQQYRVVGQNGAEAPSAAAMIDGSDAGAALRQFALHIGAKLDRFEELRLLEQAHLMASAKSDNVSQIVPAVRLIERLSPDPRHGEDAKAAIIERLVAILPSAGSEEILTLRNLSVPGFATGRQIWQGVEEWFERTNYPASADKDLVKIVADALVDEEAQPSWRNAARNGLEKSSRKSSGELQAGFWRWAVLDPRVSSALVTLVHSNRDAIERIVEVAPAELAPATAKPILDVAAKLKLFGLHAVTASGSMAPVEAARAQSDLEPGDDLASMHLALRRAKPAELLDVVSMVDDARVLRLAAEAASRTPTLLANRDMSTDSNRRIWRDALKTNPDAWRGPADSRLAFEQLLDEQIDGRRPPADLLDRLSVTPLADVTSFARRRELWRHLTGDVRDRLLGATVDAWFANPDPEVEPELADRILRDRRLDSLLTRLATGQIPMGLRVVSALSGNDNARFRRWVMDAVRATRPLSAGDADLVGRSVAARGRSDTVSDLTSWYWSGRRDLEPALRHCLGLMNLWDRLWLGISPVTDAEKRESLVELAAELYPSGPDHNSLWERAGGRDSDLTHHGSGLGRWRDALRGIQNGKPPRISKLIQEMRRDFGSNQKLRIMADDPLFRN